jgi:hypothetical protein
MIVTPKTQKIQSPEGAKLFIQEARRRKSEAGSSKGRELSVEG